LNRVYSYSERYLYGQKFSNKGSSWLTRSPFSHSHLILSPSSVQFIPVASLESPVNFIQKHGRPSGLKIECFIFHFCVNPLPLLTRMWLLSVFDSYDPIDGFSPPSFFLLLSSKLCNEENVTPSAFKVWIFFWNLHEFSSVVCFVLSLFHAPSSVLVLQMISLDQQKIFGLKSLY